MTTMPRPRLLYCSACGLSLVTTRVPPTKPCDGCSGLAFSTRQRVQEWTQRLTAGDREFLADHRIATS